MVKVAMGTQLLEVNSLTQFQRAVMMVRGEELSHKTEFRLSLDWAGSTIVNEACSGSSRQLSVGCWLLINVEATTGTIRVGAFESIGRNF